MTYTFKNVDYESRRKSTKLGRIKRDWTLEDYNLHDWYMKEYKLSDQDAAWKVQRINWEWQLCGWRAARLEREGYPVEADNLREMFGEEHHRWTCNDGLAEDCRVFDCANCRDIARMRAKALIQEDCTCTPDRDMPCTVCMKRAALKASNDEWVDESTNPYLLHGEELERTERMVHLK